MYVFVFNSCCTHTYDFLLNTYSYIYMYICFTSPLLLLYRSLFV